MNKDKRLDLYLRLLQPDLPIWLSDIEDSALNENVPIIRKQVQYFLRWFLTSHKIKNILELGTGVGFSTLFFATYTENDTKIYTIENYEKRIEKAKENIKKSPYSNKIELIEGDAMIKIKELKGPFDLIFLDSSKGQYKAMLPLIKEKMKKGSILIADNIMQDMTIIESSFAIKRRNRTIHKRIRGFLEEIKKDKSFIHTTIPIGDGITLLVKN